uniref:Uncharacterized protein n=1 Tax=Oryza meridionalis TaxID=40149 RepID=A0A0E0ETS1_9ORYZ
MQAYKKDLGLDINLISHNQIDPVNWSNHATVHEWSSDLASTPGVQKRPKLAAVQSQRATGNMPICQDQRGSEVLDLGRSNGPL